MTTGRGLVIVSGPAAVADLAPLRPDPALTAFRPPVKQKEALLALAAADDGAVFIAHQDDLLVGYCTLHPPDPLTRFGEAGLPYLLEMGAIEVSREWRCGGIGRAILATAFDNDGLEDYIVLSSEYWWHWDLDGAEKEIWTYRNMLEDFMGRAGLVMQPTSDPEIASHPANMLTVRFGSRITARQREEFDRLSCAGSELDWFS